MQIYVTLCSTAPENCDDYDIKFCNFRISPNSSLMHSQYRTSDLVNDSSVLSKPADA